MPKWEPINSKKWATTQYSMKQEHLKNKQFKYICIAY